MTQADLLSDWNTRLQAHAGRIMNALDQLRPPVTIADITQQARAVTTVKRMINLLFGVAKPKPGAIAATMPAEDGLVLPADKAERLEALTAALEAELPPMNRQQRRHAERLAKKMAT